MHFGDTGETVEEILDFVVVVDSQFYPQIGELYTERIKRWVAERREKDGFDSNDEVEP